MIEACGQDRVDVPSPSTAADLQLWDGLPGLQWNSLHTIDFYKRFLVTMHTVAVTKPGTVGWLEGENADEFMKIQTNSTLNLILRYVQVQGLYPITIKPQTMSQCLEEKGVRSYEPDLAWPSFCLSIIAAGCSLEFKNTRQAPSVSFDNAIPTEILTYTKEALKSEPVSKEAVASAGGTGTAESPLPLMATPPIADFVDLSMYDNDNENDSESITTHEMDIDSQATVINCHKSAAARENAIEDEIEGITMAQLEKAGVLINRNIVISRSPLAVNTQPPRAALLFNQLNTFGQIEICLDIIEAVIKNCKAATLAIRVREQKLEDKNKELLKKKRELNLRMQLKKEQEDKFKKVFEKNKAHEREIE